MWTLTPEVHNSPWLHSDVQDILEMTSEISKRIQGCAACYSFLFILMQTMKLVSLHLHL